MGIPMQFSGNSGVPHIDILVCQQKCKTVEMGYVHDTRHLSSTSPALCVKSVIPIVRICHALKCKSRTPSDRYSDTLSLHHCVAAWHSIN